MIPAIIGEAFPISPLSKFQIPPRPRFPTDPQSD
jgi:hypothetical protein